MKTMIKIINPCMELQRAGLKPCDVVEAESRNENTGAMYFEHKNGTRQFECVVWPDNYEVV